MLQTKICSYLNTYRCSHIFPTVASNSACFLDLNLELRHRVYREIGLEIGHQVKLELDAKNHRSKYSSALPSYTNLLQTSRKINADVTAFLFLNNEIFVVPSNFPILTNLDPTLVASFSQLTLSLELCTCAGSACCDDPSNEYYAPEQHCFGSKDYTHRIGSRSNSHCNLLYWWEQIIASLVSYSNSETLKLKIACNINIEDIDIARQFLSPLKPLRALSCTIKLGKDVDRALLSLAREAVFLTRGISKESQERPFRFLGLPVELRRQVLEYTDLVTPVRRVPWSSSEGYMPVYYQSWDPWGLHGEDIEYTPGSRACWTLSTSGCFCSHYHTVFPPCQCWVFPTSLFLVCKIMYQDALAVFFRQNKFEVSDDICTEPSLVESPRMSCSKFLSDIVPLEALRYLRNLELNTGDFADHSIEEWNFACEDWLHVLNRVKSYLCLAKIKVQLVICDGLTQLIPLRPGERTFDISRMEARVRESLLTYKSIIAPLVSLMRQGNHAIMPGCADDIHFTTEDEAIRAFAAFEHFISDGSMT